MTLAATGGTHSYGATLTGSLHGIHLDVCGVRPPPPDLACWPGEGQRHGRGGDPRTVLPEEANALLELRARRHRGCFLGLFNARDALERQGPSDALVLTTLLRTTDLGVDALKDLIDAQAKQIKRWRTHSGDERQAHVARGEAKRLAIAIRDFQCLLAQNRDQLREVTDAMAPGLMNPGSAR